MRLGVHISGVSKIYQAFSVAARLGANTMQIFSRNPQRWRQNQLSAEDIAEFRQQQKKFKIRPVFIHAPYLINLASPERKLYHASIEAYIEDIVEAQSLGVDYIVTHMGSHKQTSEEEGIKRLIEALNTIIERTRDTGVGILLENTAGSGSWLGYKFIHQKVILQGIKHKERVALCLDTAHAYLAGYDLASKEGLKSTLQEIEDLLGLDLIKLIHLNDAKGKLGTHHDRHDHIGKGSIGMEGMKRIVTQAKLKHCAFILETPKDSADADKINLATVKKFLKD
ncbi:MAG: deoxyribonuclease IV [Candidatus Omnitrophica bacterium]|nr:deoxyribonuclease IV [Candidatus Omnitrophota bacterium]